jgi:glycogen operon protein
MNVGGFTRHPSSGVRAPGTFLGVVEKIGHLVDLGINAVELLPVQEFFTEPRLRALGLRNYWGYNPLALFAPHFGYGTRTSPGCQVAEFKTMVRELHAAGIEVILDVVFNHTAEQDHRGPTLCFKGIDNHTYYRLDPRNAYQYVNWTGCGNTLDFTHPAVIRFAVECMRYWVRVMHVDGFRFDLAPILGRDAAGVFDPDAPFFEAVADDPALAGTRLIAEPWDLHPETPDRAGRFPDGWAEWNGRFRDDARRFVKGDSGLLAKMGWRLTGSADIHSRPSHDPTRSINFITCHDGFTLADVTMYNFKHNEANGEEGRDGEDHNHSWNCGVEGPSDDLLVGELRRRHRTGLLTTLFMSRGVPMMLSGDEMLHTQGGNNNAYCQDNEISWLDWSAVERNASFLDFVRFLIAFRREHPVLRCASYLEGRDHDDDSQADIEWFGPSVFPSTEAMPPRWSDHGSRSLAFRLDGSECTRPDGESDSDVFYVLNSSWEQKVFMLPEVRSGFQWSVGLDTSQPQGREKVPADERRGVAGGSIRVNPRSMLVLLLLPGSPL